MNFIRESKMLFNANVSRWQWAMPMGENRFSFSIHDERSFTNIIIVPVYGDYFIVEIANFNIYNTYWKLTD